MRLIIRFDRMHTVYLNLNQVFNFSDNTCLIRLIFIFTLYATIFLIVICEILKNTNYFCLLFNLSQTKHRLRMLRMISIRNSVTWIITVNLIG